MLVIHRFTQKCAKGSSITADHLAQPGRAISVQPDRSKIHKRVKPRNIPVTVGSAPFSNKYRMTSSLHILALTS